jgi:hypothetical protein
MSIDVGIVISEILMSKNVLRARCVVKRMRCANHLAFGAGTATSASPCSPTRKSPKWKRPDRHRARPDFQRELIFDGGLVFNAT